MRMRQALDMAAEGLVNAGAIPFAAREGLAKPIIPKQYLAALKAK